MGPQDVGRSAEWPRAFGLVPSLYLGGGSAPFLRWLTPMTSLFTHVSWLHLVYNLAALWVFGAAVERAVGRARFIALFLGLGALAMIVEAALTPASSVPIVGASGAVAALAGAFAVAFPRARILMAAVFLTVPVRAWVALGVWMAVEVAAGITAFRSPASAAGGVAHAAHVAGFLLGATAMLLMHRTGRKDFESPNFGL